MNYILIWKVKVSMLKNDPPHCVKLLIYKPVSYVFSVVSGPSGANSDYFTWEVYTVAKC